jgi:DNA-binding GntR family transcriptional regulator
MDAIMPPDTPASGPTARISIAEAAAPQIYRLLRDRIVAVDLVPGERLSEAEVARSLDVSRQPVREAFIKLSEDGLIEIRPQRGTFVRPISRKVVMDARFVREAIEADTVRLVAADPDPALIASLRGQLQEQESFSDSDPFRFKEMDERFHLTFAEAIDKPYAWRVVGDVKLQLDRVRNLSLLSFPRARVIRQHRDIVDAVAAADPEGADRAMRRHLREILIDLPRIAEAHPDYFVA